MRCPACGSDRVLVLVHSLRALCGGCMHQWCPPDDIELEELGWSAQAVSRTIAMDLPPDDPPDPGAEGSADPA